MSTENTSPTPDQPTPPVATPAAPVTPASAATPPAPGANAPKPGGPAPYAGKGPPRPGGPRPGGPGGPNRGGPNRGGDRPNRSDKPYNPGGAPQQLYVGSTKPNARELDKLIEDELAQAMGDFDVSKTVAAVETVQKPRAAGTVGGGKKTGVIVGVHGNDVFVEVPGGRSQGVLPLQQFEGRKPAVGEAVEFDIDHYDSADGLLILTREGSTQVVHDWSQVTYGMIVEARVTGTNKNKTGLTVEVAGIKGFLPASQLDLYRVENIEQFVNQRIKVMVAEVNPEERNLIVSRRAVQEKEKQAKAEEFWKNVAEGQVLKGIVRSIKPFGAFVDLGGADGLIPASEFSWQRVNDLSEFVKIGQQVEVKINRIDFDARKIGLSMKQLTVSPFEEYTKQVQAGARITGKVTRIADFGAFVELTPGVEGLIHVSELSTQRVRRVRDVIEEGQTVIVEVLSMDAATRRIALSLKKIASEEEAAAEAAEQAEHEADLKAAEEAMANRPVNPNLRGGIGSTIKFDKQ
ncbi:30s ribosomal protein s1 : Ribosomal protein S1 OS=Singulisphaera acidiphila (strain ATCC BAA-1392 / DSM 18658 / VKM B-2454 / MOB10) GN=Sinac_5356 PE=4 SV=1: S1: S1: S1 [Gemmata massiliana]|uniref:S1 motif domain-containing protein n=1 Tax=Gemmata massiliana TaxID=1210884 RepID=A0A6P2CWH2_9BACT|nr:S1 RNA-binding domain-containing protein [Gemmata massiliana]VTR93488.1 30s ribosomal protein s1 : Ribosomal protein S1 OS=Singulisphaera acidiphila (strain ATCC BAA-1392 / DSM 18658 / VKM B-2454 / MOB10) GN=Sinac_5356 PE=4 SV=1: S1: S1: S1 [Gemmata massiliana]